MADEQTAAPDSTGVRVALWRAMHLQVDQPPHVLEDEIGLKLAAPDDGWRRRPDMDPQATSLFRASISALIPGRVLLRTLKHDFLPQSPWRP